MLLFWGREAYLGFYVGGAPQYAPYVPNLFPKGVPNSTLL
jgi:hypothetical protein